MRIKLEAGAAVACLIACLGLLGAVTPASAGTLRTGEYRGVPAGPASSIELRVNSIRKRGKVIRTVTRVSLGAMPAYCADGSSFDSLNAGARMNARVNRRGGFQASVHAVDDNGFRRIFDVKGDLQGREIDGVVSFVGQNPLFESCATGVVDFTAFKNGPNR
ncbi:hypothetical protein HJD18_08090 [Thermoleophilia bacterium SCSIO 60948]|nr:hypothetical protein HJD18_08090 [Thermoleophilia bacterium SCSIO 60948]